MGIITASLTSPVFGMEALGVALFWFGLASALALLVLVTYRYVKHEVAEPFKPLFCIYAAPVALSLAGYLAVSPEPAAVLVIGMTLAAQCSLIVVLTRLPKLLRLKFYPSYAAMAFPFVVSAVALTKATAYFASMGAPEILLTALGGLVAVETVFAAVMVLFVFVHYLCFFAGRARGTQTKPAEAV